MNAGDATVAFLRLSNDSSTQTGRIIFRNLADRVAVYGLADARGWLAGWWYASGNRNADNHAVWQTALGILG